MQKIGVKNQQILECFQNKILGGWVFHFQSAHPHTPHTPRQFWLKLFNPSTIGKYFVRSIIRNSTYILMDRKVPPRVTGHSSQKLGVGHQAFPDGGHQTLDMAGSVKKLNPENETEGCVMHAKIITLTGRSLQLVNLIIQHSSLIGPRSH